MAAQPPIPLSALPRVTVTEEIIYPRSVTLEEVLRLVRDEKRTGSVMINFGQGRQCEIIWKHKK